MIWVRLGEFVVSGYIGGFGLLEYHGGVHINKYSVMPCHPCQINNNIKPIISLKIANLLKITGI